MNVTPMMRQVVSVEEHGFELRLKLECGHVFYQPGGRREDAPERRRCYACEVGVPRIGQGGRDDA